MKSFLLFALAFAMFAVLAPFAAAAPCKTCSKPAARAGLLKHGKHERRGLLKRFGHREHRLLHRLRK